MPAAAQPGGIQISIRVKMMRTSSWTKEQPRLEVSIASVAAGVKTSLLEAVRLPAAGPDAEAVDPGDARPTSPPPPRRPKSQTASFQKPNHPASPATRLVPSRLAAAAAAAADGLRGGAVAGAAGAGGLARGRHLRRHLPHRHLPPRRHQNPLPGPPPPNIAIPFSWLHLPAPTAVLSGARYRKIGRLGSHGRIFGDVGVSGGRM
jgi:hypothetical protein